MDDDLEAGEGVSCGMEVDSRIVLSSSSSYKRFTESLSLGVIPTIVESSSSSCGLDMVCFVFVVSFSKKTRSKIKRANSIV